MLNMKKYVRQLIISSPALIALVPATRVLSAYPDEVTQFPCVIIEEQGQRDEGFSDNLPNAERVNVRLHVFTKTVKDFATTTEVGKILHGIFRSDFWACTYNSEMQDTDESVKHRVMDFTRSFYEWEN